MKKTSWLTLIVLFATGWLLTTLAFAAYFLARANCPSTKAFLDSSGLDTNALTAYFTALAFVGFLVISVYQAHSATLTEQELQEERKKTKRIQHDSMWLSVQIARLHSFSGPEDKENRDKTRKEIEDHWKILSEDSNQWK